MLLPTKLWDPRNPSQGMIHMVFQYFNANSPKCFFFWRENNFLTWKYDSCVKMFFWHENVKNSQIPTCENVFTLIWRESIFHPWIHFFAINAWFHVKQVPLFLASFPKGDVIWCQFDFPYFYIRLYIHVFPARLTFGRIYMNSSNFSGLF
jgi:hypothetical protein